MHNRLLLCNKRVLSFNKRLKGEKRVGWPKTNSIFTTKVDPPKGAKMQPFLLLLKVE